jgi:hypothetical protein
MRNTRRFISAIDSLVRFRERNAPKMRWKTRPINCAKQLDSNSRGPGPMSGFGGACESGARSTCPPETPGVPGATRDKAPIRARRRSKRSRPSWCFAAPVCWCGCSLRPMVSISVPDSSHPSPIALTFYQRAVISRVPDRPRHYLGLCGGDSRRMRSMVELAVVITGLFSAGIFLAHAVEAYHAQ